MRDPARIDKVLEVVTHYWWQNPDLRFGQLLLNVAKDPELYYMEDNELMLRLIGMYETGAGDRAELKTWIKDMTGVEVSFTAEDVEENKGG